MDSTLKIYIDEACTKELEIVNSKYRLLSIIPLVERMHSIELYVKNNSDAKINSLVLSSTYTNAVMSLSKVSLEPMEYCVLKITKDIVLDDVSINVITLSVNSNDLTVLLKKIVPAKNFQCKNIVKDDIVSKITIKNTDSEITV